MIARQHPTKTSRGGRRRIIVREGVRFTAYPDPATHGAPWTNGVGHTGADVHQGQRVGPRQVWRWLTSDLRPVEAMIRELRLPDQGMFDACASLGFNLGPHIFDPSHDVGRLLYARMWHDAADAMLEYDVAAGRHMKGLHDRRVAERRQFLRGLAAFTSRKAREKREPKP